MKFVLAKRENIECLILPFWQEKGKAVFAATQKEFLKEIDAVLDFTGKAAEVVVHYPANLAKRMILLGLGPMEKISLESLRKSYAAACKSILSKKLATCHIAMPKVDEALFEGVAEGLALANYAFDKNKSEKAILLQHVFLMGIKDLTPFEDVANLSEAVFLARDLVSGNADDITPQYLSELAHDLQKQSSKVKTKVLGKAQLEKEGLGLLLAVAKASFRDPALIIMEYKGNSKSKENPVIIGKGITYDTGGLLIKPRGGMEDMRADMAGAAAGFGALLAAIKLNLKVNFTVVVAAAENSIGSRAYKTGDVYTSYSGKSVEIADTDAEGRLVLADAISYAKKHLKPTQMIDLATLTGAMMISLGDEIAGLFSNDDTLAHRLFVSGQKTHERLWRMPLCEDYKEQLKSDIADMRNKGDRNGGAITAALFLSDFAGNDVPWAHLDIAGPAFYAKERSYMPKNGTGFGVRLLVDYLGHAER